MWVLPDTYLPSSVSVQDMVETKEDLSLLKSSIEQSLMWRSKPSPFKTWLTRWNRVPWLPHLFIRMLKPSRVTSFETKLTSSLPLIPARRSARQAEDSAIKTPGTCGPTSTTPLESFDLAEYFAKTSKDTSRLDSPQSSAIWKNEVTTRRGEYSARLKQALATNGNASTLWPTPRASEYKDCGPVGSKSQIHMDKRSYLCARVKDADRPKGCLAPAWTEWLMGVPIGWTSIENDIEDYGDPLPIGTEPALERVTETTPDRIDRIRLLGNGVQPQTAAIAWKVLDAELKDAP